MQTTVSFQPSRTRLKNWQPCGTVTRGELTTRPPTEPRRRLPRGDEIPTI